MRLPALFLSLGLTTSALPAATSTTQSTVVPDALRPVEPAAVGGVLGERLTLWRTKRLWRVADDPFLLEGFVHPPGKHPWQGEHVGKWLDAASRAYDATHEPRLDAALRSVAGRLIASQAPNGYLGTYAEPMRFFRQGGDRTTWDIWTHRYTIYGLLRYSEAHDDAAALPACTKAGDLLAATLGPPKGDITRFGTRHGLSSAVLLESVVLLYERTGEPRYLEFARQITKAIEANPQLRIMAAMSRGEDVTVSGDGKAYQLMSVLLGYVELYRATGGQPFLDTAVKAWERIRRDHINLAGGPWSYQVAPTTNHECFAPPETFHPTCCVETCSTTTWIQLGLSLFKLTGEPRYADEAERALFNQLMGAQSPNGNDWAYHSMLNMPARGYEDAITCCASSGPRALEVYAQQLVAASKDGFVIASYVPATLPLGDRGQLLIEGNYPFAAAATLRWKLAQPRTAAVDLRLPAGATALAVKLNGTPIEATKTPGGLWRLNRTWQDGDELAVTFDFALRAHFQPAADGLRWVGFTWGPLALAQTLVAQTDFPEYVLPVKQEAAGGEAWLTVEAGRATPRTADNNTEESDTRRASRTAASRTKVPAWRLTAPRKIVLVPYALAGSEGGGVRTMWPTRAAAAAARE